MRAVIGVVTKTASSTGELVFYIKEDVNSAVIKSIYYDSFLAEKATKFECEIIMNLLDDSNKFNTLKWYEKKLVEVWRKP